MKDDPDGITPQQANDMLEEMERAKRKEHRQIIGAVIVLVVALVISGLTEIPFFGVLFALFLLAAAVECAAQRWIEWKVRSHLRAVVKRKKRSARPNIRRRSGTAP